MNKDRRTPNKLVRNLKLKLNKYHKYLYRETFIKIPNEFHIVRYVYTIVSNDHSGKTSSSLHILGMKENTGKWEGVTLC